jgi:ABC-type Fe3+ transport system permease subunit
MFRRVARDPFFLSAYVVFFVALLSQQFLESKYDLTSKRWRERSKVLKGHWRDPWVITAWVSFACTLLLLLLGASKFPFPDAGP